MKRPCLYALASVALSALNLQSEASAGAVRVLIYVAPTTLDEWSTRRLPGRGYEANPVAANAGRRVALKAGSTAVAIWADSRIKGPTKWILRGAWVAFHVWAVQHNEHLQRR